MGKIQNFNNNIFEHSCSGSLGSSIINIYNDDILGVNKIDEKNMNYGLLFKESIIKFIKE